MGDENKTEIDDMNKIFDEFEDALGGSSTASPGTKAPATDLPGTQAPPTEAPATDAPSTKAPATEAPTTEAPAETEAEKENKRLREEMEELKKKVEGLGKPATEAPTTVMPIEEQDFIGDEDVDELTRDKESFNKMLNKIYTKAVRDVHEFYGNVPKRVEQTVARATTLRVVRDNFFENNPELKPHGEKVSEVWLRVAKDNPDKDYKEWLEITADEVRKELNLKKGQAPPKTEERPKGEGPPKLPHTKGRQRSSQQQPNKSPMESELEDMDKALET